MEPSTLEDVLFNSGSEKKLFVLPLFENERPLQHSTGLLDWRFRGLLSRWISEGKIHGAPNETVYIPVQTKFGFRHLLVVGLGNASGAQALLKERMQTTVKLAKKLNFTTLVLSRSQLPQAADVANSVGNGLQIEVVA